MLRILLPGLVLALAWGLGCTAVCVRDSDCMGASICSENRCILVGVDAGRSPVTPPGDEGTPSSPSTTPRDDASDAGSGR